MKRLILVLPVALLALTGCSQAQRLNQLVNESSYAIEQNSQAIAQSTEVIRQNRILIEQSNQAIEQNRLHLEKLSKE